MYAKASLVASSEKTRSKTGRMTPASMSDVIVRNCSPFALMKKRIAYAMALGLPANSKAQKSHDLLQEPVRSVVLGKIGIGRTGDGDELSTGLQHPERSFERIFAQTIQDDVVAIQDLLEIVLLVIDDDIGPQTLDQIDIRGARRRRDRRAQMLRQ